MATPNLLRLNDLDELTIGSQTCFLEGCFQCLCGYKTAYKLDRDSTKCIFLGGIREYMLRLRPTKKVNKEYQCILRCSLVTLEVCFSNLFLYAA